jgi:hypothetical protein
MAFMALFVVAAAAVFTPGASAVVAGGVFTTNDPNIDGNGSCLNGPASDQPKVNCNLYGSKNFVWTNGGPSGGQNNLSDGTYFFAVVEPGGQGSNENPNDGTSHNLSDTNSAGGVADPSLCGGTVLVPNTATGCGDAYTNREFTVADGKIATSLGSHVTDDFYADPLGLFINLMPYDTTSNPGGVYILAVCKISDDNTATEPITLDAPVAPSSCKYDAFKAPATPCTDDTCTPPSPFGVVSGLKYYDANANGQFDPGEVGISSWKIDYGTNAAVLTDTNGEFSLALDVGSYTFQEEQATNNTPVCVPDFPSGMICQYPWTQTGNTVDQSVNTGGDTSSLTNFVYTVGVTDSGTTTGLNFGNICVGAGGGLTIGFWSNKNGAKLIGSDDLQMLRDLNLRNADGSNFDPTTVAQFQKWILSAKATNMANMLSAQLAAMELNVLNNKVNGGSLIYAPGTQSANSGGYATVNAVMAEANTELGAHGLTKSGSPYRSYQQDLKNALDRANNNLSFVQSDPSKCVTPVFP